MHDTLWVLAGGIAFVSGAGAAIGSSVVKVPLAVCIRSVQAGRYPNALAAAQSIVDTAGVRSLFTVSRYPLASDQGAEVTQGSL